MTSTAPVTGLEAEDDEPEECALCGGPLMEMGTLGQTQHLRCRNCGMMFVKEPRSDEVSNG